MLSRHADACYWIGRYVERAEATARMIDVHYHGALETYLPKTVDARGDTDDAAPLGWQSILAISSHGDSFRELYDSDSDRDVIEFFVFDPRNSDSIAMVWQAVRENSRYIRELISSEMWQAANMFYLELHKWNAERVTQGSPHEFFQLVKNASHLFQGILNRTMIMGETREWLDTGRFLERAWQTGRLLDVKYHDLLPADPSVLSSNDRQDPERGVDPDPFGVGGPLDTHGWLSVLKSVSAFEMFLKVHRDGIRPASVVEFLVLNPQFPASVRHCVGRVEGCLRRISGTVGDTPVTEPERLVGRLRADLTYTRPEEIIAGGLHSFLENVQQRCNAIGNAITETYLR